MAYRDVVVVGGSAGGLEALQTLLARLPTPFPAAILVVLHIPSYVPSRLPDILARIGPFPVAFASNGETITPGRVWVAPPDHHLLVEAHSLRVTRGPKENRVRPAIDTLFRSAACTFGPRVIGIVLSGALDDGTAGLWTIKDRGGIAIVQSPTDAIHPSMPESAIEHVAVDYTLPVADLPPVLAGLTREFLHNSNGKGPSGGLELETAIALGETPMPEKVMDLGDPSTNTCPECHGVLTRIREGSIVRYRCHTGHAYSTQTLLAEVSEQVDVTLWNALRAVDEHILLLREVEQLAREERDLAAAEKYAAQLREAEQKRQPLRDLLGQ